MVKQLVMSIIILSCMFGYNLNCTYAQSKNEGMVENYVEIMKRIESYGDQLQKLPVENKENLEQEEKRCLRETKHQQRQLDNLLKKKGKLLEETSKKRGEEAYLKRKNKLEEDEAKLRKKIIKTQAANKESFGAIKNRSLKKENSIREKISKAQKQLQRQADEYSRFNAGARNILDVVSRLNQPQNEPSLTRPETPHISSEQKPTEYFTVFDIPLGATPQEVANALEPKKVYLRGVFNESTKSEILENFEQDLIDVYRNWKWEDKIKEVLNIFDSEKFKTFGFRYGDEQYYLYPSSFAQCCYTPIFETHYKVYNSQFHMGCSSLPKEMTMNGIDTVDVLFASIDGETPRSFFIGITGYRIGSNEKIIPMLTEKYGEPKVYYPPLSSNSYSRNYNKRDEKLHNSYLGHLKSKFPNNESRQTNIPDDYLHRSEPIHKSIYESLYYNAGLWNRPSNWAIQIDPFHVMVGKGIKCLFEWRYKDITILVPTKISAVEGGYIKSDINRGPSVVPASDIVPIPESIIYVDNPIPEKLCSIYKEYHQKAEEVKRETKNKGMGQF